MKKRGMIKILMAMGVIFFTMQMNAGDREIIQTTKDPKGKEPLPETTSLLINGISSMATGKRKFDLGIVSTNLKFADILALDEDSKTKMFALQKSLLEGPKNFCSYGAIPSLCNREYERDYEIVLGSHYQDLLAVADKQGWSVNERRWDVNGEGIIVRHKGNAMDNPDHHDYKEDDCGKCLFYSSLIPLCASMLFLCGWAFCPKMIACAGPVSKKGAIATIFLLEGTSGCCLASGGICYECNTRGEDYQRLQKLYAIIKIEK